MDGEEIGEAEAYGGKYLVSGRSKKVRKWYVVHFMLCVGKGVWKNEHSEASRKCGPSTRRLDESV